MQASGNWGLLLQHYPMVKTIAMIGKKTIAVILDIPVLTKAFAVLLCYFAPVKLIIHALIVFLIIDAITSIYYQYSENIKNNIKKHRWLVFCATIESSKLRRTLEKLVCYVLSLMVVFMFDTIFLKITPANLDTIKTFSLTNASAILIGLVEITSILSNISKITRNPVFNKILQVTQKNIKP